MSQKSAIEKQPIIAKAAIHEGDTGSPAAALPRGSSPDRWCLPWVRWR